MKRSVEISVLFLLLFCSTALAQDKVKLVVSMDNFSNNNGFAQVALYNKSSTFLSEDPYMACSAPIIGHKASCEFEIERGVYAVAVLHDVNKNKKMDKNLLGIPMESYGFSRNVRPALRAPYFDEAKFQASGSTTINISLK